MRKGFFGNIYDQFKGKVKEAFDFLVSHKSGDLLGVFHDDELGDIDLVWGSKESNAGLEHIIDKHVGKGKDFETVDDAQKAIQEIIANGNKIKNRWDKVTFDLNGKRVVVRKNVRDNKGGVVKENKNWVVTSFDDNIPKSNKTSASTIAAPESDKGSRAVAPDVSESKDTQSSESPNENGENNELTDAQVKALAFVTGMSEEEIRAQQGGLPYDAKGEKTLHHPATLRAAYESGNAADIARAEKAVGDYIMSSDSIEKLDSTAKEFAARKKQAEKGSAEYRMDDFCEKKCRERIKEIKRETAEVKEPTERIDDVGEKIGGARKDLAQNMSDKIDLDADIRFRVANENQAIFVSNAAKAVGSIKQDKATPDQWLAMIQKQGGIKAGEDKWLGLSDWLKASDKKSLTKQEVLDYINQNKIQIEEQRYSGR